jgi:hypothetical protein
MANKKRERRNNKTNRRNKSNRRSKTIRRSTMNGGQFSVPISKFYPQNTFENDPSRQSSMLKGGKKHSRKYLRGGNSGFFSQIGSTLGASQVAEQITGVQKEQHMINSLYKV